MSLNLINIKIFHLSLPISGRKSIFEINYSAVQLATFLKNSIYFIFLFPFSLVYSQNNLQETDSSARSRKYIWGGVPIVSFDADIGFRYGANLNCYRFDDTSGQSKNYSENLFLRGFNSTTSSFQVQAVYETDNLFKKAKTYIEASYVNDLSYSFYGFNGDESVYASKYETKDHPEFIHSRFYQIHRKSLRMRFDYQHYLISKNFRLLTGYTYNQIQNITDTNNASLYTIYNEMELIPSHQSKGGKVNYFSIGLVYDQRDNPCYTSKGTWWESFVIIAPSFVNRDAFSKLILSYRTYQPLFKTKFIGMLRSSVQAKLSGEIPFYFLNTYIDSKLNQDGVGGAFNLRGFSRNRIASDGFIVTNLEVRRNVIHLCWRKKDIDIDVSIFSDHALNIQKYDYKRENIFAEHKTTLFNQNDNPYYGTIGLGCYIILNKISVINMNYGFPINSKENLGGLYIGSSFLF